MKIILACALIATAALLAAFAILACALIATAALLAAFALSNRAASASAAPPPTDPVVIGSGHLTEDDFWKVIDYSARLEADSDAQRADLRRSLELLTPDQIADFERLFDEKMRQSYTWNLWGAAYLANGGASDDGFEYFRCWLISKGRRIFETVSTEPDRLPEFIAPGEGGDFEFEEFAYVAREAWAAKTRRDWNAMPVIANMAYDSDPAGRPFSEKPAELRRRYPKLWARFGTAW